MVWVRNVLIGGFIGLVVLFAAFSIRSLVRSGEILPGVSVSGVELGGMGRAATEQALLGLEDELVTSPVVVLVNGTRFQLDPLQVGFELQREDILQAAFATGRRSSLSEFADWVTRRKYRLDVKGTLDEAAAGTLIDAWEEAAAVAVPFNGAVAFVDGALVSEPVRPGFEVDRERAFEEIKLALLDREVRVATLPLVEAAPLINDAAVDAAMATATELLAGSVILESEDPALTVTFESQDLGAALTSVFRTEPEPGIDIGFDAEVIATQIAPLVARLEAPPRDAVISISEDDEVLITPGSPGTLVDADLIAAELTVAAYLPGRTAPLPLAIGVEPNFSTADAQALGIKGLVSEFTTFHSCCQPRVTNIQRMADLTSGTIVMPGDEFSLNEHIGLRTEENGFVEAPMILRGEFVPAVGGGVSQFATTLFNAVFLGGYENVYHQPHSYYFSRYPEGREATVSFPNPELIFRNDTRSAMLIYTEHTDESITVKVFGDNEGRIIEDSLSPRRTFRSPVTEYQPDSGVEPGTEIVKQSGSTGWTITLFRMITYSDGTEKAEEWDWTYRPQPRIVRVHPCDVSDSDIACPTTTLPPETTTTATIP